MRMTITVVGQPVEVSTIEDLAAARAGTLDREQVESDVKAAGIEVTPALIEGLLHEAAEHAERRALENDQRQVVAGLGVPTYELPRMTGGVDLGALYELAGLLREQGMA